MQTLSAGSMMGLKPTKIPINTDPYWANVVLLASFDGADAATSYTEKSNSALSATFFNSAALDTAQSVFGSASLELDNATNDYVTFPSGDGWDFGSGDFTVEFRIRWVADPGASTIGIIGHFINSAGNQGWEIGLVSNNLRFVWSEEGTVNAWPVDNAWNPAVDTWYAVAVVRSVDDIYMFIDGTQIGTTQNMVAIAGDSNIFDANQPLDVGRLNHSGVPLEVDGWLDEIRITKGVARYTANYDVATGPFPTS